MDNIFFMAVVLVIWAGIFLYLLRLDRRVSDLIRLDRSVDDWEKKE